MGGVSSGELTDSGAKIDMWDMEWLVWKETILAFLSVGWAELLLNVEINAQVRATDIGEARFGGSKRFGLEL